MNINENMNVADSRTSMVPTFNREAFLEWLSAGNLKKSSPSACLACIDKISEYALLKKISSVSLWEIARHDIYKPVYNKLLEAKLLRVTDRNTYKVFVTVGQLYYKFLKEKPLARLDTVSVADTVKDNVIDKKTQLLFTKSVDWSLLHYGFTIPKKHLDVFFDVLGKRLDSSNPKTEIRLVFNEKTFSAKVYLTGHVTQVRWIEKDDIAVEMRSFFSRSYEYLKMMRMRKSNETPFPSIAEPIESLDIETNGTACQLALSASSLSNGMSKDITTPQEKLRSQNPTAPDDLFEEKSVEPTNINTQQVIVTPKDFLAWLITQPNAHGKLYLANVVRQYIYALRTAPTRLNLHLTSNERNLFACNTVADLNSLWDIFKAAPNYKQVNSSTSGAFSAGIGCLARYLEYLAVERDGYMVTEDIVKPKLFGSESFVDKKTLSRVDLWNEEIKQTFCVWMETHGYSAATAKNYCSAFSRAYQRFDRFTEQAIAEASSTSEVFSKFFALLKTDDEFLSANATAHNQFTAAISAFTQFANDDAAVVATHIQLTPQQYDPKRIADFADIENYLRDADLSGRSLEEIASIAIAFNQKINPTRNYLNEKLWAVVMPGNRYIHRDCIIDLDEASQMMLKILNMQFAMFNGYSTSSVLYDAVRIELTMFLNDNNFNDSQKVYFIARHLFSEGQYGGSAFVFYNNTHIWRTEPEYSKSNLGVLMSFIKSCGGNATKEECTAYLDKVRMSSSWNVNGYLQISDNKDVFQYCSNEYVLSDTVGINDSFLKQIRQNLDLACESHPYVILRAMNQVWYDRLPNLPHGFNWEYLLLQEIIEKHIPEYRTIGALSGQDLDTIKAGVVHKDSPINSLADLVYAYIITEKEIELPKTLAAEEFREKLRQFGMIKGNELIYNMHKALNDRRFAWKNDNGSVTILAK